MTFEAIQIEMNNFFIEDEVPYSRRAIWSYIGYLALEYLASSLVSVTLLLKNVLFQIHFGSGIANSQDFSDGCDITTIEIKLLKFYFFKNFFLLYIKTGALKTLSCVCIYYFILQMLQTSREEELVDVAPELLVRRMFCTVLLK